MSQTTSRPRPICIVLDELAARRRQYLELSAADRALIDRHRILPVLELHDILAHWMMTGKFVDEYVSEGHPPVIPHRPDPNGYELIP